MTKKLAAMANQSISLIPPFGCSNLR
jgi:hypothetical protein